MNINHQLREDLVMQANAAFIALTGQLNYLFDLAGFYMQRYQANTISEFAKLRELDATVEQLGRLPTHLAHEVQEWKIGCPRKGRWQEVELNILIEIWANIQALMYFLVSHNIDLEPFDETKAHAAFVTLCRANRLLT